MKKTTHFTRAAAFTSALLAISLLSSCSFLGLFGSSTPATKQLTLTTKSGAVIVNVEVEDTAASREQGLMGRDKLEDGKGMWFVFQDEAPRKFWMKNMLIPIDLIFLNSKKEVTTITQNLKPCTQPQCPLFPSNGPAMYVLELPAGSIQSKNIAIGDKVTGEK